MSAGPAPVAPVPQGNYRPATRFGDFVFTSGMTPRVDGQLRFTGPVCVADPIENWKEAVVLACRNALIAARALLGPDERVAGVPSLTVFILAESGFTRHSALADFASEFLHGELGESGIGSRAAVGVASLPANAPVEIQMTLAVAR